MRILWVSDSPTLYTGYARVGREILNRLHKLGRYEIRCLGWYYDGRPYDTVKLPFDIYRHGRSDFGQDVLGGIIDRYEPDVMITFGDIWMISWIANLPQRHKTKWIGYTPIDGEPLPHSWVTVLANMDVPVCCSRYGQKVIADAMPDIQTELIYLGVDVDIFAPVVDKQRLKESEGIGNRFVVGCVARNQPRKQLPILIKAFAKFSQDKDNVLLYLHTTARDVGWDLEELLVRYRLQYKSYIPPDVNPMNGVSDVKLSQIYNYFDIFALPSMSEGFGLPILESMAVAVPVIATNYSAPVELVEGRGELIKVKDFLTAGTYNIEQALADTDDLASKLELLYSDSALRDKYGALGRKFALSMTWDIQVKRWVELLDKVLEI